MFKKIIVIFIVALFPTHYFSQAVDDVTPNAKIGALTTGNLVIESFFGAPNFYRLILETAVANNAGPNVVSEVKGIGPLGIRGEYMINDKFGFGLDVAYLSGQLDQKLIDLASNAVLETYSGRITKIGFVPCFNRHFSKNDLFDAYFGGGIGFKYSYFKSTKPGEQAFLLSIPVAWRFGIGVRFFPIQKLAIGLNVGIGQGGIINFGIAYKIK